MTLVMGHVRVWINAFLPRDVDGYTQLLRKGANAGKTAVLMPKPARVHPGNLIKRIGTGFLTDQRTFSPKDGASVRMRSMVDLHLWPPRIFEEKHTTSGTVAVDMDTGETLGTANADMSNCFVSGLFWKLRDVKHSPNEPSPRVDDLIGQSYVIGFQVHGEAGDPLVYASANIDYDGLFYLFVDADKKQLRVRWHGAIDAFPAFEAYAEFNNVRKQIFAAPPPRGNTVMNLLGDPTREIEAEQTFGFGPPDPKDVYRIEPPPRTKARPDAGRPPKK